MLKRPGVRITGYSLGLVGWSLLITAGRSHMTSCLSTAAGVVAFLVAMLLFLATLKLSVPARYVSNPRFQRFDIALGFACVSSIALVLASLVLTVLATDGRNPHSTVRCGYEDRPRPASDCPMRVASAQVGRERLLATDPSHAALGFGDLANVCRSTATKPNVGA